MTTQSSRPVSASSAPSAPGGTGSPDSGPGLGRSERSPGGGNAGTGRRQSQRRNFKLSPRKRVRMRTRARRAQRPAHALADPPTATAVLRGSGPKRLMGPRAALPPPAARVPHRAVPGGTARRLAGAGDPPKAPARAEALQPAHPQGRWRTRANQWVSRGPWAHSTIPQDKSVLWRMT